MTTFNFQTFPVIDNTVQGWNQQLNDSSFQLGNILGSSNNTMNRLTGQSLVSDSINNPTGSRFQTTQIGQQPFQKQKQNIDWGAGFQALSQIGSQAGGITGQLLTGSGNVGSSIINLTKTSKAVGGFKNLKNSEKAGSIGAVAGAAADMLGSFMPEKQEYSGDKGNITQTVDSVYDGISDAAMSIPGWGQLVGGAMKASKLVGQGLNAIGGGTDAMTGVDAVLGSSFLNLTPIGLINGFGGSTTQTMTKNDEAFARVGGSYAGSNNTVDDALKKSGKKYGLFSSGAKSKADAEISEAKRQQSLIENISDIATDRANIQTSMSAINSNRRMFNLQGGYNQSAIRMGKNGMLLEKARAIIKAQKGNKLEPFDIYYQSLPKNQQDSTNFRVRDYWEFNGQPKDFNEAIQKRMFIKLPDGWHARSVMENPKTGEIEYMKAESHPTRYMESDWYEKGLVYNDDGTTTQLKPGVEGYENWKDFTNNYELQKTSPYWKYVKRKSPKFQNGGSINVIPDGALHARKHNMEDADNLTKKGIPVVDNNGEQQAEIEKNEVILRLEVTQELEKLTKKYYSDDYNQKEKEMFAIKAGQLLVFELLHNTVDNTGLLNEV